MFLRITKLTNSFSSLFRHVHLVMFITFLWIGWILLGCVLQPETILLRSDRTDPVQSQVDIFCMTKFHFNNFTKCFFFFFPPSHTDDRHSVSHHYLPLSLNTHMKKIHQRSTLKTQQACAPRYEWFSRNFKRREPVGTCYTAKNNFADFFEYSPCRTSKCVSCDAELKRKTKN